MPEAYLNPRLRRVPNRRCVGAVLDCLASERAEALEGPKHRNRTDCIGGGERGPAGRGIDPATNDRKNRQDRGDKEQLTDFDADIEQKERKRDGVAGKADNSESSTSSNETVASSRSLICRPTSSTTRSFKTNGASASPPSNNRTDAPTPMRAALNKVITVTQRVPANASLKRDPEMLRRMP